MNILSVDNYRAVVTYDPIPTCYAVNSRFERRRGLLRSSDIPTLKTEGAKSLTAFLNVCKENGTNPELHARAVDPANLPDGSLDDCP